MRRAAGLALILGLTSACRQASPPAAKPIIALGELTVRFDGDPIARLHADGRTESIGDSTPGKDAKFSPGPTLHADGTVDLTKGGFKARVDADGSIYVIAPNAPAHLAGRIVGDQFLSASGDTGVRVVGTTLIGFADGKDTALLGKIDPPSMKRTALVMTEVFFIDMATVVRAQ
jgi:hypothetical protein